MLTRTTLLILGIGLLLGGADASAQQPTTRRGTGWIGIRYDLISQGAPDGRRVTLVRVTEAVDGGPAAIAGIEPGDTILRLNGTALSVDGWTTLTRSTQAGDRLRLTIQRDGRRREVLVSAEERPALSPSVTIQIANARRDMISRMESVRDRVERANGLFELAPEDGDSVRRATLRLLDNLVNFNYSVSDSGYVTIEFSHGESGDIEVHDGDSETRVLRFRTTTPPEVGGSHEGANLPPVPSDRWIVLGQEHAAPEVVVRIGEREWTGVGAESWVGLRGMASNLPLGVLLLQSSEADSLKEHVGRLQIRLAQVGDADARTRRERARRALTRAELRENERMLTNLAEEHRVVLEELSHVEGRLHLLSQEAFEEAERLGLAAEESLEPRRFRAPERLANGTRARAVQPTRTAAPEAHVERRPSTVTAGFAGQNTFAGAQLAELNAGLAAYFDVEAGVLVTDVYRGTPAARNGVQAGDVIIRLNQAPIRTLAELRTAISRAEEPGLRLVLLRRGREVVATFPN